MSPLTTLTPGPPNEVLTVAFGGKVFRAGRRTAAHLQWTQAQLDKKHPGCRILVIQPCFSTGVAASEGTHDWDAVLDVQVVGMDWLEAQGFLRAHGWAAWYRHPPAFSLHIHMISLGCTGKVGKYIDGGKALFGAVVTSSQIDDYYRHSLGLAGQHASGLDHSWFPDDIPGTIFDFAQWERDLEDDMQAADWDRLDKRFDAIVGQLGKIADKLAELDDRQQRQSQAIRRLGKGLKVETDPPQERK